MKQLYSYAMMMVAGTLAFTSCEKDIDDNPVLIQNGGSPQQTIVLNAPEFGEAEVALKNTETLTLTWSQPQYTDNNAPLGSSGSLGTSYVIQLSKDGNFTRSFETALKEVTNEDGSYSGKPTGHDFVNLASTYPSCSADVPAKELNTALNKLYVWDQSDKLVGTEAYIRIAALLAKSNNKADTLVTTNEEGKKDTTIVYPKDTLAYSNIQKVRLIPSEWEDVMVVPAKESYLWVPGNGNGWNHGVAPILVSEDGDLYTGYAYMDGEFKFTPVGAWDGEYNNSHFTTNTFIDCGDGGGGNINFIAPAGLYYLTVDLKEKTFNAQAVTWGVIGAFNSWGGDEVMTYDTGKHCLTVNVNFAENTEWKFRRDGGWDVNLGGSLDELEPNGANLTATAGAHTIELYIERPAQDKMHAVIK